MLRFVLVAALCLSATAEHNDRHAQKSRYRQRMRQRNRASNLVAAAQAESFSSSLWLKVGTGCCRSSDEDGHAMANDENVGCDQGGETDLASMDRINVENKGECKDACAQRTCCVAFEWRGRARSGANCDLFDTAAYPNACTKEGTTCASGASCWKKNLMIANVSVLTSYAKTEADGCCRGATEDSLTTVAELPVLDPTKRKRHLKNCQAACDLVPECNAIESAFNVIYSGRCDLISGSVTSADNTPVACRGTGCYTKQCPGDLRALIEEATSIASLSDLVTGGGAATTELNPSTDHSQGSESNDEMPMILAVVACTIALLVAGTMTAYYFRVKNTPSDAMTMSSQTGPMLEIPGTQGSEVEDDAGTASVSSAV